MAHLYKPMLLTKVDQLPEGDQWSYEPKLDGYRAMAYVGLRRAVLISREGNDFTYRFPEVADQLPGVLDGRTAVFDGEVVALDDEGRDNFRLLQRKGAFAVFYAFDAIEIDGEPTIRRPLAERREILRVAIRPADHVRIMSVFSGRDPLVHAARDQGLEGVVAKRLGSLYRPGKRNRDWQKQILLTHPDRFLRR